MEGKCIGCHENCVIYCKKRMLCSTCYQRQYREEHGAAQERSFHLKEVEFIKNFFRHQNWVYQPATFRINKCTYSPDFYDAERDVFIEVSGTHQAFYDNRDKYHHFMEIYPKIKFEVRMANGEQIPLSADVKGTYPIRKENGEK